MWPFNTWKVWIAALPGTVAPPYKACKASLPTRLCIESIFCHSDDHPLIRCLHHARGKAQSAGGLFQHLALAKKNRGRNWQQWQMFDLSLQVKEVNLSFCMATFIQSVTNSDRLSRALQRDMSVCRSVWMMLYTHTLSISSNTFKYHQLAHGHFFPTSGQMFATMVVLQLPPKESWRWKLDDIERVWIYNMKQRKGTCISHQVPLALQYKCVLYVFLPFTPLNTHSLCRERRSGTPSVLQDVCEFWLSIPRGNSAASSSRWTQQEAAQEGTEVACFVKKYPVTLKNALSLCWVHFGPIHHHSSPIAIPQVTEYGRDACCQGQQPPGDVSAMSWSLRLELIKHYVSTSPVSDTVGYILETPESEGKPGHETNCSEPLPAPEMSGTCWWRWPCQAHVGSSKSPVKRFASGFCVLTTVHWTVSQDTTTHPLFEKNKHTWNKDKQVGELAIVCSMLRGWSLLWTALVQKMMAIFPQPLSASLHQSQSLRTSLVLWCWCIPSTKSQAIACWWKTSWVWSEHERSSTWCLPQGQPGKMMCCILGAAQHSALLVVDLPSAWRGFIFIHVIWWLYYVVLTLYKIMDAHSMPKNSRPRHFLTRSLPARSTKCSFEKMTCT